MNLKTELQQLIDTNINYTKVLKSKNLIGKKVSKELVEAIASTNGNTYIEQVYNFLNDSPAHNCQYCGKETPLVDVKVGYRKCCNAKCRNAYVVQENERNAIEKLNSFGDVKYISGYKGSHSKVTVRNEVCGHEFSAQYLNLFTNKQYCPICGKKERTEILVKNNKSLFPLLAKKTSIITGKFAKYVKKIEEKYEYKCLTSEEDFINHKNFKWQHTCGEIIESKQRILTGGPGCCSKCGPSDNICSTSYDEVRIREFVKSVYAGWVKHSDRSILYPNELDIYIPELKFGIEFNGVYWHSTMHKLESDYHRNKTIRCNEQDIHLMHIYEDDFYLFEDQIFDRIQNKLSRKSGTFKIKKISEKKFTEFIKSRSLMKLDEFENHLGAFEGSTLIGVYGYEQTHFYFSDVDGCLKQFIEFLGLNPDVVEMNSSWNHEMLDGYTIDQSEPRRFFTNCEERIYSDILEEQEGFYEIYSEGLRRLIKA
jgi:hypothetical protein